MRERADPSAERVRSRDGIAGAPAGVEGLSDLLRRVAASSPGAICSFLRAPDGSVRMPFAAPSAESIYGLPLEALAHDFAPVLARVHAADAPRLARSIEESAQNQSPWHDAFRYAHPTRGERWIEGWSLPSREPDGSVLWHGFVMDVTARTLAEQRAEHLDRLYRTIVAANEAIVRSRDEGELLRTLVNAMLGLEGVKIVWIGRVDRGRGAVVPEVVEGELASLVRGRTFPLSPDVPGGGSMPSVAARTGTTVLSNELGPDERAGPVRDDAIRMGIASALCAPVRCRGHVEAVLTIGSKVGGFFDPDVERLFGALALDLSRALDGLADARELAASREQFLHAQRLDAVGRLAGGVAHDFNNLLTVIKGFTRLALDEPGLDPAVRSSLDQVIRAAIRAAGLTRQLLAFSRHLPAEVRVVDLGATVKDMERMLRTLLGETNALAVRIPDSTGESPCVRIDPGQLEQVVMNLALNARDAMPLGGELTLVVDTVAIGPPPELGPPGLAPGPYTRLRVIDTGSGMTPEVQARLFEPFFTTKGAGKGTGLGLATVYGIVRQAHGSVRVESAPGRGSTFEILLPRVEAAADPSSGTRAVGRPAPGTETVLVVEDEPAVRELETTVLQRGGYSVLAVATPSEAIRRFETATAPIALVVSDVILPGMSGPALVQQLRQISPGLPALFVSGYPGDELPESQGDRCLAKPVPTHELLRAVRDEIDRGARGA